jgi:hypothetical protein
MSDEDEIMNAGSSGTEDGPLEEQETDEKIKKRKTDMRRVVSNPDMTK